MNVSELFHIGHGKSENYFADWDDIRQGKIAINELKLMADSITTEIKILRSLLEKWDMADVKYLIPLLNKYENLRFNLHLINDSLEDHYDIEYSQENYDSYDLKTPFPTEFEKFRGYVGVMGVQSDGTALIKIGHDKAVYLEMPGEEIPDFYKKTNFQKFMVELGVC